MASKGRKTRAAKETESSSREEISIEDSGDDEIITSSSIKRTVNIKSVSGEKPCATSTPASNKSRSQRSSSPLTIQRTEEKEELSHLNDRLAYYIDYVRSLENAKEKLTKKIKTISQSESTELDKLRGTYEDELRSLRKMVDDLAKERANLEIDLKNAKEESLSNRRKADRKDSEIVSMQRRIDQLERELSKQKTDSERYMSLLTQHDVMEKKCAKLTKDLDAEIILRTDLENRNVTLKEQLEFNNKIHNEERVKLRMSHVLIEEEVEDRKMAEFESRLSDELRQIREETAEEFESYKIDFEESFMVRLNDLKKTNIQSSDAERKLRDEMYSFRSKSEKLEYELASKTAEIEVLNKRVKDLESLLSYERRGYEEQLCSMRLESDKLREELQHRLTEFSNLMSTKIALDQEILMYRKLLEGEEARCNLPVKNMADSSFSMMCSGAGVKRRRVGDRGDFVSGEGDANRGNTVSFGRDAFRVDAAAKSDIEFTTSPDCSGKCVKLLNRSDKDVCVGGWTLTYKADNMETTYKFHHNLHIKAHTDCTIWSSDANETHNPPTDLVMKGQRFFTGNKIQMSLINTDNSEEASCKIEKESLRSTTYNYNRKVAARGLGASTSNNEKCSLM